MQSRGRRLSRTECIDRQPIRATYRDAFIFFFSSRRRHTRFDCDWSSDVCSSDLLLLGSPQPVPSLTDTDAPAVVRVDPSIATRIDAIVSDYVKGLTSLDPNSPDFAAKVRAIHAMASDDIRQSASVSNRLLDKPIKAMESGLFNQSTAVSKSLVELRR